MINKYHIRYSNEESLESILSTGQGEPISAKRYDDVIAKGIFPTSKTIIDKFGSWRRALNLAGFYPKKRYCLDCGKKFEVFQRNKEQRFCSDVCSSRYYRRNFPDKVKQQLRESFYKRRKTATAVAAKKLGRKYIGIDSNREYVNIALKRLQGVGKDKLKKHVDEKTK